MYGFPDRELMINAIMDQQEAEAKSRPGVAIISRESLEKHEDYILYDLYRISANRAK